MADLNILPGVETDDFNELLGDIAPKTGFGEARFVVTRNGKIVDIKIKASDALVRSVAREHFEGEELHLGLRCGSIMRQGRSASIPS